MRVGGKKINPLLLALFVSLSIVALSAVTVLVYCQRNHCERKLLCQDHGQRCNRILASRSKRNGQREHVSKRCSLQHSISNICGYLGNCYNFSYHTGSDERGGGLQLSILDTQQQGEPADILCRDLFPVTSTILSFSVFHYSTEDRPISSSESLEGGVA